MGFKQAAAGKATTAPAKKSDKPVIEITDPKVVEAAKSFKEAKEKQDEFETQQRLAEGVIIPIAVDARRKWIQSAGRHEAAVKIKAGDVQVQLTVPFKYSKLPQAAEDKLKAKGLEKYFKPKMNVSLKDETVQNEKLMDELFEAAKKVLGEDRAIDAFNIEQVLVPTDALEVDRDLVPEVAKAIDEAVADGTLKPTKPSLRL